MLKGFRKKQEDSNKLELHAMRNIMWACLAPHQKKGSDLTPEKLMPFEWEKQIFALRSEEEEQQMVRKLQKTLEFYEKLDAQRGIC